MVTPTISAPAIEQLLNEFHHPSTGNVRKHAIETQLVEYQNTANAWHESLYHLANTSNQYLWFFNVSTVELIISRRWHHLRATDRDRIRETIWQNYTTLGSVSKMQRDKIAQLIALIGKREFPDDHTTYMNHVIQLIGNDFNLGITLLRTTSEELSSTKDDIPSERKSKFHAAMSASMAEVFDVLRKFLSVFSNRINCCDLQIEQQQQSPYPQLCDALPREDKAFFESAVDCLVCIQHLLSWISLDAHLSHNLVSHLFDLAMWRECASNVSVAGLMAITELFYRQVALPEVTAIAKGLKNIVQLPSLKKSNEMYQDKLTELLKLFATQHWNEWAVDEDLPSIVTALYHFTFSGYGALAFTERLAIWCPMIQGLSATGCERYIEIVQLLVSGILRKMQFRFDQESELDILDNESLDDDMETEWQHYLTQCIDTIVLIAEGRPYQVFEQVYSDWQRPYDMFMTLEKSPDGSSLVIADYHKCHLIHCVTRDLSSLCQTLTSLIPIIHFRPDDLPHNIHNMTINLVNAVSFLSRHKLHNLKVSLPQLTTDFIEFYAQILSALRSYLLWSPALRNDAVMKPLIENIAYTLLPPSTSTQEPKIVTLAAAQLLLSISGISRPKYGLDSASLQQLIQAGHNLHHMDKHAAICVHQTIVNCFVLPWPYVSNADQDFERRNHLLQEYVGVLAQDLLRLDHTAASGQHDKIITVCTTVLPVLKDVLDYFKEQNSSVKTMLMAAYKPSIVKSISLFNSFGTASADIAGGVLNFCLSVIRTLQVQLGSAYIKEMLGIFLEASTREHITTSRLKAIDKLLQMLLLVVEQPGSTALSLLPAILNVSLDLVTPLLSQQKQLADFSDVAISLFSLFDGILHHRWQYFYKSQVLRGFSPGFCDSTAAGGSGGGCLADDGPQHAEQLLAILTGYGHAIVAGNDPHITRILLTSLQSLNERFKLFGRPIFKENLLSSFHVALINALISPEGALHIDLLLGVLFTMGQVNPSQLHASFMTLGYSSDSKMVESVCLAVDLPTFSQRMSLLIQDTRCSQFSQ